VGGRHTAAPSRGRGRRPAAPGHGRGRRLRHAAPHGGRGWRSRLAATADNRCWRSHLTVVADDRGWCPCPADAVGDWGRRPWGAARMATRCSSQRWGSVQRGRRGWSPARQGRDWDARIHGNVATRSRRRATEHKFLDPIEDWRQE
jgi:hypothetical protein